MNSTKKLTHGAMLLALLGAFMLLDRYAFALYFDELVFVLQSIIIIIYACKYTLKDGVFLCIGVAIICLLFGGLSSWVYCPLAILSGLVYSYGLSKDWNRRRLFVVTAIIFIFGEMLLTMGLMPLLGVSLQSEINEMNSLITSSMPSEYLSLFSESFLQNIIIVSIVLSLIILGIMEAAIIHLLSIYLLKRFRIKENIKKVSLYDIRFPAYVAYIAFFLFCLMFIPNVREKSEELYLVLTTISFCAAIFLMALGIIYLAGRSLRKGNRFMPFILVILLIFFPYISLGYIIIGFLYCSGALKLDRGDNNETTTTS